MIKNDEEFEQTVKKIVSNEKILSWDILDEMGYYLLTKKEIPSLQMMKLIGTLIRMLRLESIRMQDKQK